MKKKTIENKAIINYDNLAIYSKYNPIKQSLK